MKLTVELGVLVSALCCLVSADTGRVYILDPPSQSPHASPRDLPPATARVVLAQRTGVEDYHSADLKNGEVIDAINDYGVRTSLFGQQGKTLRRALFLLEGFEDAEERIMDAYSSFSISPLPSAESTRALFLDLSVQRNADRADATSYFYQLQTWAAFKTSLESFHSKAGPDSEHAITILVTPSNSSRSTTIEAAAEQWGTYTMPHTQSQLRKRSPSPPQAEEPLELDIPSTPNQSISPLASSPSTPKRIVGILPSCFTSQSACESQTNNCSSHGQCYKKYTDNSASSNSRYRDCYTCQCSATVVKNGNGQTKTTYWGGSGCQKKDVSTEFWIIALFTVGLVSLISFAVGTVWSMGNEELPSVIGAGVSGPTAKK